MTTDYLAFAILIGLCVAVLLLVAMLARHESTPEPQIRKWWRITYTLPGHPDTLYRTEYHAVTSDQAITQHDARHGPTKLMDIEHIDRAGNRI